MHPSESLLHILFRFEALHELNHLQVRYIDFRVFRKVVVLFGETNTLWNKIHTCLTINCSNK
ncbi:hypothetical protein Hanom_Chr06g00574211 [Helianthus anomalus]